MAGMKITWVKISKDIGLSVSTLRRYVDKYDMPVLRTPSGRVMFSKQMFEAWIMMRGPIKTGRPSKDGRK